MCGRAAPAAAHPAADPVSALLTRHFTAINDHDYEAWRTTVVPRRIADQPRAEWDRAFRSTRDSDVGEPVEPPRCDVARLAGPGVPPTARTPRTPIAQTRKR